MAYYGRVGNFSLMVRLLPATPGSPELELQNSRPGDDNSLDSSYTLLMKSPFPGMDPYLEARWGDVHQRLITYAADQLAPRLPADLRARVEERVFVEMEAEQVRNTNLVEIDLLRSGTRVIAFPENRIPAAHRDDHLVCIRCAWAERARELFALSIRERLPAIPIPLRKTDSPVLLELQALLDQCYENGRYDDIDYTVSPIPALSHEHTEWAQSLLKLRKKPDHLA
jgi:hypothetical protein